MPISVMDDRGKVYAPDHPDYDKVRIRNLELQVGDLLYAIVDLQNRVSRLDSEPLEWPGDTYGPRHTEPFNG